MYATLKTTQPRALQILENSIKNNRLSHAYLFTGPKGTYKKEMAFHLAMMLYCGDGNPCYECENCRAILENRHLNVHYIEPFGQSIKKEQILALQEEFSKTSLVEGPRIYIINEADTMSTSAANSLLKFIEEPSEEVYGILITEHKDNMLSTIISRSMVINFNELDKKHLKEKLEGIASPLLVNALSLMTSNLDEARDLLENDSFNKVILLFEEFVKSLKNKKLSKLFYKTNIEVLGNKERLKTFLILLESLFRDVYEYYISASVLTFDVLKDDIESISNIYTKDEVLKYLNNILDLIKKIGYNVNMNLLINQFLIDLNGGI